MTDSPDPYDVIDPILMPWARRHGIRVFKIYRDDPVRSIWIYDKNGDPRGHIWAEVPDTQGNVTIVASALDPTSPTKCGAREERRASLETLEVALEELRPIMLGWAGEGGAFGG
jgi:hypothetical protein